MFDGLRAADDRDVPNGILADFDNGLLRLGENPLDAWTLLPSRLLLNRFRHLIEPADLLLDFTTVIFK